LKILFIATWGKSKEKPGKKADPGMATAVRVGKPEKLFHNDDYFINFCAMQQAFFTHRKYSTMLFLKTSQNT
jgi:hypothetical protein